MFFIALLFAAVASVNAAGPVNRHLPFYSSAFHDLRQDSITANAVYCPAGYHYWSKEFDPKRYYPFGGMPLDLKDLAESYNYYYTQQGLPTKDYLSGTGPDGLAQYRVGAPMDSFVNTVVVGSELSFHKKFDGIFDDSLDQVKHLDGVNRLLTGTQLFMGANLPLMSAKRFAVYQPGYHTRAANAARGADGEQVNEKLRMKLSEFAQDAGLDIYNWSQQGMGDLDFYVGIGNHFDYVLRCAGIDVAAAIGMTVPTGKSFDINNPLSFSLGRDGISFYTNLLLQAELKRGLLVGAEAMFSSGSKSTMLRRLPLKNEAEGWAPAKNKLTVKTGSVFSIAPFIEFKNFMDWWLDCRVGFSYTVAQSSSWTEARNNSDLKIFFQDTSNLAAIQRRINNSGWDAKYFHVKFSFTPEHIGMRQSLLKPTIWLAYDHPWERALDVPCRKISAGVKVDF